MESAAAKMAPWWENGLLAFSGSQGRREVLAGGGVGHRRRVVALLPDREQATAEAWLRQHPGISIVSRDRGGGYGETVARALRADQGDNRTGASRGIAVAEVAGFSVSSLEGFLMSRDTQEGFCKPRTAHRSLAACFRAGRLGRWPANR